MDFVESVQEMEKPENLRAEAINSVRDYLVESLYSGRWCVAKRVGNALELLVGGILQTTLGEPK